MKPTLKQFVIGWLISGLFFGLITASDQFNEGGCTYPNILARTSPGFFIGCEIVRKRW